MANSTARKDALSSRLLELCIMCIYMLRAVLLFNAKTFITAAHMQLKAIKWVKHVAQINPK